MPKPPEKSSRSKRSRRKKSDTKNARRVIDANEEVYEDLLAMPPDMEMARINMIEYYDNFQRDFNNRCYMKKLSFEIDTEKQKEYMMKDTAELFRFFGPSNPTDRVLKGRIFDTQVYTFIDMLSKKINGGKNIQGIGAPMQWGKSTYIMMLAMMEPIFHYVHNPEAPVYSPVILLPNKCDLESQIKNDLSSFCTLHKYVKIICKKGKRKRRCSCEEFWNEHDINNDLIYELSDGVGRNYKSAVAARRNKIKEIKKRGRRPLLIADEAHYGTKDEGVLDSILEDEFIKETSDMRLVSATGYESEDLDDVDMTWAYLSRGWWGPIAHKGVPYPLIKESDREYISTPEVREINRSFDIDVDLDTSSYSNIKTYLKNILVVKSKTERDEMACSPYCRKKHKLYKKYVAEKIADIIIELLYIKKKYPLKDAQGNDIRGGMLRCPNAVTEEFVCSLNKILESKMSKKDYESFKLVKFYSSHNKKVAGSSKKTLTVEEKINEECGPEDRYMVLVVNHARMGTCFPRSCGFFIDPTRDNTTRTSQEQGTFGRMCGWNRNTIGFFSPKAYSSLMEYLDNNGVNTKRPHMRAVEEKGMRRRKGRGKKNGSFDPRDIGPWERTLADEESGLLEKVKSFYPDFDHAYFCRDIKKLERFYNDFVKHFKNMKGDKKDARKEGTKDDIANLKVQSRVIEVLNKYPFLMNSPSEDIIDMDGQLLEYEPDEKKRQYYVKKATREQRNNRYAAETTLKLEDTKYKNKNEKKVYSALCGNLGHRQTIKHYTRTKGEKVDRATDKGVVFHPQIIINEITYDILEMAFPYYKPPEHQSFVLQGESTTMPIKDSMFYGLGSGRMKNE